MTIALTCLKDRDIEHPSAAQLCEAVEGLKGNPTYHQSVKHANKKKVVNINKFNLTIEYIDEQQYENSTCRVVKLQQENMHLKQQLEKAKDQAREYDQLPKRENYGRSKA